MAKGKRSVTKSRAVAFRLREPDLEALIGLSEHYRIGRSEVIRYLLTAEWAKIKAQEGGGKHEQRQ